MKSRRIAVVGGGPTGCLAGTILARQGHEVTLFEQRSREACIAAPEGRSINLAIPRTTVQMLLDVGVERRLAELSVPLRGRIMHARSGELTVAAYGDRTAGPASPLHPSEEPVSVGREVLGGFLLQAAEREPRLTTRFGHRLIGADLCRGRLEFETGSASTSAVEADIVVGADGAFSTVRTLMVEQSECHADVKPSGIWYRELAVGAVAGGPLTPQHFHLWPRRGFMLVALPNSDGTFTFTLFALAGGPLDLEALLEPPGRTELFRREFPDLADLTLTSASTGVTPADMAHQLVTVRCNPWHHGRAVLAGDACHALLPFAGRGTAEGLADCIALARGLAEEASGDLSAVFEGYARLRQPLTDGLADVTDALAPLLLAMLPEKGLSASI